MHFEINFYLDEFLITLNINNKNVYKKLSNFFSSQKNNFSYKKNLEIFIDCNLKKCKIYTKKITKFIVLNKKNKKNLTNMILWVIIYFVQDFLAPYGYLFIHASSFFYKKDGYLFIGSPGSGKSTIISNLPHSNLLSNDIAIIKRKKGDFFIQTNFFEKNKLKIKKINLVNLKKIFFIKKSKVLKTKRISKKLAIINLIKNLCSVTIGFRINKDVYKILFLMLKKPIFYLFFPKKFSFNQFKKIL